MATAGSSSSAVTSLPRDWRRRSADVGGLHLALAASSSSIRFDQMSPDEGEGWEADYSYSSAGFGAQGQGWMGGEGGDIETMYAELLSDMYNESLNSVNDNSLVSPPPPIPENVRDRLIRGLDKWDFEPHKLPDEEVLASTLLLFEALFRIDGMEDDVSLTMEQITAFIHHLRRIYRYENKYHNFEHALDVLQATQSYLKSAGLVPPPVILFQPADRRWVPPKFASGSLIASLGKRELFMLYVSAIGHDVGHPGFSNMFMKNAQAPLAVLFNHGSALEYMHCHLLLCMMRYHGFGVLLDDPLHGKHLRKLVHKSVLATDMGVHGKFMETLKSVVDGEQMSVCERQIVLCQAILKNADISNPTRPFLVSKHWATALIHEWTAQAHLEKSYHLQQTVPVSFASYDPIKEADSQIFFIRTFARPLLELTQRAIPEMQMYTWHCRKNLEEWVRRRRGLERERDEKEERLRRAKGKEKAGAWEEASSSSDAEASPSRQSSPVMSPDPRSPPLPFQYHTAFPLTLPPLPQSTATSSASGSSSSPSHPHSPSPMALSVPDSPTGTDASECRSVASHSSSFSVTSSGGESTSTSNLAQVHARSQWHAYHQSLRHQPSFLSAAGSLSASVTSSITSSNALVNATTHAAIRAAGKVGSMRMRKKKSHAGLGQGAGMRLPPLPSMVVSEIGAGTGDSDGLGMFKLESLEGRSSDLNYTFSSVEDALPTPVHSPGPMQEEMGTNSTLAITGNISIGKDDKILNGKTNASKTPIRMGNNTSKSFRFKSSARNSWAATTELNTQKLFQFQAQAQGLGGVHQCRDVSLPLSLSLLPSLSPLPSPSPSSSPSMSPLPPGRESWVEKGKEKEKGVYASHSNLTTTTAAAPVKSTKSNANGSRRTTPNPSPTPNPTPRAGRTTSSSASALTSSSSSSSTSSLSPPSPSPAHVPTSTPKRALSPPSLPLPVLPTLSPVAPLMTARPIKVQVSP